jgi:hypothetical protein
MGDFVMVVKENHKILRKKIACIFANPSLFGAEYQHAKETTRHYKSWGYKITE